MRSSRQENSTNKHLESSSGHKGQCDQNIGRKERRRERRKKGRKNLIQTDTVGNDEKFAHCANKNKHY